MRQIAGGRADHPHVDLDPAGAADALEGLLGEDAQILAWVGIGMSATSSEKQRAAVCLLEQAGSHDVTALLLPEQFLLDPLRRHARGADDDDGALARGLHWCSSRAAISLPEPAAPVISTRLPVAATRLIVARTLLMTADEP